MRRQYPSLVGLLALCGISVGSHAAWCLDWGVLTAGDWGFFWIEEMREFVRGEDVWLTWGLGMPNMGLSFFPFMAAFGLLAHLDIGFAVSERLLFMIPITLIPVVSSYALVWYLTRDSVGAFVGACVYSFNTYFLTVQTGHLTVGFSYAMAPLVVLCFMRLVRRPSARRAIWTALSASILGVYEIRVGYLVGMVCLLYSLYAAADWSDRGVRTSWRTPLWCACAGFVSLCLHSYWLVPLIGDPGHLGMGAVLGRPIFGDFMKMPHALTLFHPFWTGGAVAPFVVQPIPSWYWLMPIGAACGVAFPRRGWRSHSVCFFALVGLIGVFLTKQHSPPFGGVYEWLFENFPGFSAFREASKFYLLIGLSYSVLIGSAVGDGYAWMKRKSPLCGWMGRVGVGLAIVLLLVPAKALVTGEVGELFAPRVIPTAYLRLKEFLKGQRERSRVLHLPATQRYAYASSRHPSVSAIGLENGLLPGLGPGGAASYFERGLGSQLARILAARFVVLPLDPYNELYRYYGSRRRYASLLASSDGLHRVHEVPGIEVYENPSSLSHVSCSPKGLIVSGDLSGFGWLVKLFPCSDLPAVFYTEGQQGRLEARTEQLTDALTHLHDLQLQQQSIADLVLEDTPDPYYYGSGDLSASVAISPRADASFAFLAKNTATGDLQRAQIAVRGAQVTAPDPSSELTRLLRTSRAWRYVGNAFVRRDRTYEVDVLVAGREPLSNWKLKEQGPGFDVFGAALPDYVPGDLSSRDGAVVVYRNSAPCKMAADGAQGDRDGVWVEEGRVMVNVPRGERPRGGYTFSYRTPLPLSTHFEGIVAVPVDSMEMTFRELKSTLSRPECRLSHLFVRGSNSFYVPKSGDHLARVHVALNVDQRGARLRGEGTDWEGGSGLWSTGSGPGTPATNHAGASVDQPFVLYAANFYQVEDGYPQRFRWGRNNMEFLVMNPSSREVVGTLWMEAVSIVDRDLQVVVNGELLVRQHIASGYDVARHTLGERLTRVGRSTHGSRHSYEEPYPMEPDTLVMEGIRLRPGVNEVVLHSPQGTQVADELIGNGDLREVSLKVLDSVTWETGDEEHGGVTPVSQAPSTDADLRVDNGRLKATVYFDGDEEEHELVVAARGFRGPALGEAGTAGSHGAPLSEMRGRGVDLERYQHMEFGYELDDPSAQGITAACGIDTSGDGVADGYVTASWSDTASTARLDLLGRARERFSRDHPGGHGELRLVKVYLILHKTWGLDAEGPSKRGLYRFAVGSIDLVSEQSVVVPGFVRDFRRPEDMRGWRVDSEHVTYVAQTTADGLLVSAYLDSKPVDGTGEKSRNQPEVTLVMQDGRRLTGVLESADDEALYLLQVQELGNGDAAVQRSKIDLIFTTDEAVGSRLEPESVTMTAAVGQVIPGQHSYLGLTYKVQDQAVQTVEVALGLDSDGDGSADTTLSLRRSEELGDWEYVDSVGAIDLYRTSISADFPEGYTTQGGAKGLLEVFKDDTLMTTTWQWWSYDRQLVQVGMSERRQVMVGVPTGTSPGSHTYTVRHLPMPLVSTLHPGFLEQEISVRELLEETAPGAREAAVVQVGVRLLRIGEADVSAPERRGNYDFHLKEMGFYDRYAFPLKDQTRDVVDSLRGMDVPLVRLMDEIYGLDVGLTDSVCREEGVWLPSVSVRLDEGVHEDGVEILPHRALKADLVELANRKGETPEKTAQVRFRQISPSRCQVFVKASGPFELVFSEAFHPGWVAYARPVTDEESAWAWSVADTTDDGTEILSGERWPHWSAVLGALGSRGSRREIKAHYVVNGYANGWHVETDLLWDSGSGARGDQSQIPGEIVTPQTSSIREFEIELEHEPKRLFEVGLVVSALALVGCIGYLSAGMAWRGTRESIR